MIQGGGDRSDLRPLDSEGNVTPGSRGNHKGAHSALNVQNPQPGFVYYWQINSYDALLASATEGWQVVQATDPERKGAETSQLFGQAVDGAQLRRDVVLMRIPEDRYRVLKQDELAAAHRALHGTTDNYLSQGQTAQRRYGAGAGGPIYYRGQGHSTVVEE